MAHVVRSFTKFYDLVQTGRTTNYLLSLSIFGRPACLDWFIKAKNAFDYISMREES